MATVQVRRSISPVARGAGTTNGTGIPIYDTDTGMVLIGTGTLTDGSHVITLEESDQLASGYTTIPAARVSPTPPTITNTDANKIWVIDFRIDAAKTYVRAVITTTGGTAVNIIGAYVLATLGVDLPPSNPQT